MLYYTQYIKRLASIPPGGILQTLFPKEEKMNKLFAIVIALMLSSSAFACDVRCGPGYSHGYDQHRHDHRGGQSIGREIAEVGVGDAIAVAALQIGSAIGGRVAQEISGTPPAQGRVVYVATPVPPVCDTRPFVSGGLVYANPCDGSGIGAVVVGRVDRR